MAKKTWTTYTHTNEDGTTSDYEVASNPNPKGPPRFVGADECTLCRFTFPRDQFEYFRGKPYCIPRGCNRDIPGIRRIRSSRRVTTIRER
jgi:hypothetical protein